MPTRRLFIVEFGIAALLLGTPVLGQGNTSDPSSKSIVVASTTSTQDSGLFGYILPIFKAKPVSTCG
jgi:tungstate transport system substrate-binding protein